jgi:hypothetical protein
MGGSTSKITQTKAFQSMRNATQSAIGEVGKEFAASGARLTQKAADKLTSTLDQYSQQVKSAGEGTIGGCYESFAMSRATKAGGAELDRVLAIGGCGCSGLFVGAADIDLAAIKSYSVSANASAKEALVDNIIESLSKLGLKYDSSAATSQAKLQSLINSLPSTFKSDAASQTKTIGGIVGVINKTFGTNVIDVSTSPEESAKRILEVLHSLTAGMHSEYLMVYDDLITTITNLRILVSTLEESLKKIDVHIKDKVEKDISLANLRSSVDLALGESKRQLAMLESLLNTTLSPADKSISKLLEKVSSLEDIEKLSRVGDKQFGKTIHDILSGMGVTANLSIVINNALKTVGMTLEQYAKTSSVPKLMEQVETHVKDLHNDEETSKFFNAVKTLTGNLYRAGDFAKLAEQNTSPVATAAYEGSAEYEKTVIEKQIKNRKNVRNLIFTAFNKKVQEAFNRLISTIDVLSVKIGTDVPITTDLDGFRNSLSRIDSTLVYQKNIYYALIGYYNDALSKSKREEFIAELKVVKTQAEIVASKPEFASSAGLFNEVIAAVDAIVALIDQYSDEISSKFGSDEVADVTGGCGSCDDARDILGGDDDDLEIKPVPMTFKSVHNIHDAVTKFDYRFKVAQIRRNLAATSAELSEYGKDYDKIVTNSIYEMMAGEQKKYVALRAQFDEGKFGKIADYIGPVGYANDTDVSAQKDAAIKILDSVWKAKQKFWATVEAVDKYMQVFTDALVKNPEDVQDIKSMLDSIEIISDWYTDATGNSAAGVFDYFPRGLAAADVSYPDASYREGPGHYYKRIGDKYADPTTVNKMDSAPGNPYLVADPREASGAFDQVKKTFEGLSVLKNLISVFVHVGSKFGGEELRSKIFMTPSQMYNNLVEYVQASSFAQGYGLGDVKDDDLPEHFNKFRFVGVEETNVTEQAPLGAAVAGKTIGSGYTANAANGAVAAANPPATNAERSEQFRGRWGVWMRSIYDELKSREGFGFKNEDEYFVLMLKSLAAKIFTVVGMYEVFDRPMEFNGLSPIRMTIGGAEGDSMPKIDEAVAPLYLRLTLLAQFYRKIFSFTPIGDAEIKDTGYGWVARSNLPRRGAEFKISMVPDVMGTFSGFIRLMFRKVRGIEPDNFSDDDVKEIILEVNSIYAKLKDKYAKDPVIGIIQEFVAEVNRRYAIVSKSDRDAYESEFGSRYDRLTAPGVDDDRDAQMPVDIPLLPGEEDSEVTKLTEFQRRLDNSNLTDKITTTLSKYKITPDHKNIVREFRCAIDKFFDKPEEQTSFDGPINNVVSKLKLETRDDQRFKLVASLIRGTDAYTKIDGSKYVLFHETVIGQLNLLSGIHSMLSRFKLIVQVTDIKWLETELVAAIKSLQVGAVPVDMVDGLLVPHLLGKLKSLGLIATNDDNFASAMITKILGRHSNIVTTGGSGGSEYIIKRTSDITAGIDRNTPIQNNGGNIATARDHLLGVLDGVSVNDLGKDEHKKKLQTVYRYIFDRKFIMKMLLESLFGLSSDLQGLVQISWDRNKISVNAGGIKKLVVSLFDSVNYFIDALRPQLDKDFVREYTDKVSAGSLYWLQEQLIEKIIEGRDGDATHVKYDSLERVMQTLSNTYKELTREWTVDGTRLSVGAASAVNEIPSSRDTYDKVLAELIFYDGSAPESGIAAVDTTKISPEFVSLESASLVDYIHDPFEALHFMGASGSQTIDTRYIHRFKQLYGFDDKLTNNKSALFMFNQLVAKFIKSFYDPSTQKIYSPLLSQFANGVFSRSVSDHTYSYPDTVPAYFLKFSAGENTVVSSEYNFKSFIRNDQIARLDDLYAIIKSYLAYGGANINIPSKDKRLDLSDPALSGSVVVNVAAPAVGPAAININMPKLYCLLLIAAASGVIVDLFTNVLNGANRTIAPAAGSRFTDEVADLISVPTGIRVNSIDAGAALYGAPAGINPTFDQVMSTILNLGLANAVIELAAPNRAQDNQYRADLEDDNGAHNGIAARGVWFVHATANAGSVSDKYLKLVNHYLTLNDKVEQSATMFTIAPIVLGKIPYRLPSNPSEIELKFASNTFAGMIMAFASRRSALATEHRQEVAAAGPGMAGTLAKISHEWSIFMDDLFKHNQGPSVYVPPTAGQPKTDVKRDDIIGAVTEDHMGAFGAPSMHSDYILVARNEHVNGALKSGNIGELPGTTNGKPGKLRSGHAGPDVDSHSHAAAVKFGNRMDPDSEHVLFSSLANILKSVYQSRNSAQGTVYLHESIADVALYMKEKYRANLPAFKNLFNELRYKCEFIKKLLDQQELNVSREFSIIRPTHNPWPYVLKEPTVSDSETKTRFSGILDTIIQGCNSLISACDQVLREVGDEPKYFEMYGGSIRDYKSQYGSEPFMPITSMLRMLVNANDESANDLLPVHSMGEEQFKLMYGVRGLLASMQSEPMSDNLPGFKDIVEQYNAILDPKLQVSKDRCDAFVKSFVRGLRFMYEAKHLKGVISPFISFTHVNSLGGNLKNNRGLFTRQDLIVNETSLNGSNRIPLAAGAKPSEDPESDFNDISLTNKAVVSISTLPVTVGRKHIKPVYALVKPLADVLKLTESSDKESRIRELVEYIKKDASGRNNSKEIQNIIDLNIVPINIHALRREIPLVNLYNYAYTFDRMIIDLYYGLRSDAAKKLIVDLCDDKSINIASAKDMLVSLLIDPYRDLRSLDTDLWNTHAKGMLVGIGSEPELGRPKFLSDQIYNKAVFGEMYVSDIDRNEMGPAAATVFKYKPTKKDFIATASMVVRENIVGIGNITNAGIRDPTLATYVSAAVKMFADNPKLSVAAASTKLSTNTQGGAYNRLPIPVGGAVNAAEYDRLALATCLWSKIVVVVMSYITNIAVNGGLNIDGVKSLSDIAAYVMVAIANVVGVAHADVKAFNDAVVVQVNALMALAKPAHANAQIIDYQKIKSHVENMLKLLSENIQTIAPVNVGTAGIKLSDGFISLFGVTPEPINVVPAALHWLDIDSSDSRDRTQLSGTHVQMESYVHAEDVSEIRNLLALVGRARFDTKFIRNLVFIVNLFRSVRVKLQRDLTYSRDIIQRSAAITRNPITEFTGNLVDKNQSLVSSVSWSKY